MTRRLILLVEDSVVRAEQMRTCFPDDVHCVWAKSAGSAIGILARDQFSAILLDHDLGDGGGAAFPNGEAVATSIIETQSRKCEVWIHSHSPAGARKLATMLKAAGFPVEQRPWELSEKAILAGWLSDVLEQP